jgi:hypothetical protein
VRRENARPVRCIARSLRTGAEDEIQDRDGVLEGGIELLVLGIA